MTAPITWQKSSFSQEHGDCLELAAVEGAIRLRESDHPHTVLTTTPAALHAFLRRIKAGVPASRAGS